MEIREKINYLIQKNGYISIDAFMSISMTSETNSYYRSKDPINKDFITSPEISQIFGEMIGIWVIDAWNKLGCPKNVSLVEFGSGRGTLLRDLLKIAKLEKSFYEALNISIIDINEVLIDIQKETLKGYNNIKWVTSINEVPKFPTIIIANEFFDALPIKQYQKKENRWMERVIISDEDKNLNFSLIVSNNKALNAHQNAKEGAIFEESIESKKIMGEISNHIALNTGAALIIDYGYDIKPEIRQSNQYNDTLQAIKNHRYINIFEEVGEADLTSHIDFDALKKSINSDVKIFGAITQRNLLLACGIDMRLKSLQKSNPTLSDILEKQYDRLVSEKQMGNLFKAIAIFSGEATLLGFTTE